MDQILASQLLQLDSRHIIHIMPYLLTTSIPNQAFLDPPSWLYLPNDVELPCARKPRRVDFQWRWGDWGWWGWCWMWRRRIVMKHRAMNIHWGQHTHYNINMTWHDKYEGVYIYIHNHTQYIYIYVYVRIYLYIRSIYTLYNVICFLKWSYAFWSIVIMLVMLLLMMGVVMLHLTALQPT